MCCTRSSSMSSRRRNEMKRVTFTPKGQVAVIKSTGVTLMLGRTRFRYNRWVVEQRRSEEVARTEPGRGVCEADNVAPCFLITRDARFNRPLPPVADSTVCAPGSCAIRSVQAVYVPREASVSEHERVRVRTSTVQRRQRWITNIPSPSPPSPRVAPNGCVATAAPTIHRTA
jgi:hypothetical protein